MQGCKVARLQDCKVFDIRANFWFTRTKGEVWSESSRGLVGAKGKRKKLRESLEVSLKLRTFAAVMI